MGSYTEVALSFYFRGDVPSEVLSAFSALAVPAGELTLRRRRPAPALPAPVEVGPEVFEPTSEIKELYDPAQDPTPWKHDWARWFGSSMSASIVPSAQLIWSQRALWHLTCRWGMKSYPHAILPALLWLGPYIEHMGANPLLIGHMIDETEPRPYLLWLEGGTISIEDLNPPFDDELASAGLWPPRR